MLMVVGALAGGVLAFYDFAIWVGILSSCTGAVVAWCEFSGTEKKLDRYSNIVISLKSIKLWWNSLPEVCCVIISGFFYCNTVFTYYMINVLQIFNTSLFYNNTFLFSLLLYYTIILLYDVHNIYFFPKNIGRKIGYKEY